MYDTHAKSRTDSLLKSSRQWLSFGSFFTGLAVVELDPSTGKLKSGATPVRIAQRPAVANNPIEAPAIVKNGNFYYLFSRQGPGFTRASVPLF